MEVMLAIRKRKITLKKDGRLILRETLLNMASDLGFIGLSGCTMRMHISTDWHVRARKTEVTGTVQAASTEKREVKCG